MSAHHHHGQDAGWSTPLSVRRALAAAAGGVALFAAIGLVVWWPRGDALIQSEAFAFADQVDATVTEARIAPCSYDETLDCNQVALGITSGSDAGDTAQLEFGLESEVPAAQLDQGDKVVLNDIGAGVPPEVRYSFADFQRRSPMWLLVGLFAAVVIAVGRLKGMLALAGLVISIAVVIGFVLPALLRGSSPVGVALTGAAVIALAALYLAHGFNERTTVALLGTSASLVLTAILATIFSSLAELTGLAAEESINLLAFAPELDFRGLLLAAVIIGSLGVLDDVTVTQVSAVSEIHRARPDATKAELYWSAVQVGRDHIASATNTLVLAYTAAALPLLLIFTQSGLSLGEVATSEVVAIEIVQTLVSSIGLVCAVPITTAVAARVIARSDGARHRQTGNHERPEPLGS